MFRIGDCDGHSVRKQAITKGFMLSHGAHGAKQAMPSVTI